MKAIKLSIKDKTVYALPLTFGQLEDNEETLQQMFSDAKKMGQSGSDSPIESLAVLRQQLNIIVMACQNYNPEFDVKTARDMTMHEIALNFPLVISGSGMVEVETGKPKPGR